MSTDGFAEVIAAISSIDFNIKAKWKGTMRIGRTGATATGWLLLMLGGGMALVIGKGDIIVIAVGLLTAFAGIYALSLVNPGTKQFMGSGWPENFCRISAAIVGIIMMASGLISSIGGIRYMLISHSFIGINFVLIGFLPFGWGLYILKLATNGVQS